MLQRFAGRTCVVTASSQGIGLAIAQRFALEGGNVIISSRKQDQVDKAVKDTNVLIQDTFYGDGAHRLFGSAASPVTDAQRGLVKQMIGEKLITPGVVKGCVCHVGKAADRAKLFAFAASEFGTDGGSRGCVDVLVLNAASSTHYGKLLDMPEISIDKMMETNIKSNLLLAQEAKSFLHLPSSANNPSMETPPSGASLFPPHTFSSNLLITSSLGAYVPCTPIAFYSTTKTALVGLTKALSVDYAALGVRVNCVCPGVIQTRLAALLVDQVNRSTAVGSSAAAVATSDDSSNDSGGLLSGGFMRRVGVPEEVAGAAAFLCSRDASFVTGESLVVGGGSFGRL